MAITLECPRCSHKQKIDDEKAKKPVPCKICHHMIKPAGTKDSANEKAAASSKDNPATVQAGPPPAKSGTKPAPAKKPQKRDDDDEGDDPKPKNRPRPTRSRTDEEGNSKKMILLAGGGAGLLLVLLLCGGGSVGAYFAFFRPSEPEKNEAQVAQNDRQAGAKNDDDNKDPGRKDDNRNKNTDPAPKKDPDPNVPDPFKQFPPRQDNLDPADPKEIDKVLTMLKGPANERGPAYTWLSKADTNHARRAEVTKILDEQVLNYINAPTTFGPDGLFSVFFRWATINNVPTIVRVADSDRFTVWDNRYRQDAMRLLGKFKDARGVDTLVRRLGNAFDGGVAEEALREMGSVAESGVLPLMHDPGFGNRRDIARRLLTAYKTPYDTLLTRTLKDLGSTTNNEQRNVALQWLVDNPPADKARTPEISKALNFIITDAGSVRRREVAMALDLYGTKENVPALLEALEKGGFGTHEVMRALGKLKDERAALPIAKQLERFGGDRNAAALALIDLGPVAQDKILPYYNHPDGGVRQEARKIIAAYKTDAAILLNQALADLASTDSNRRNAAIQTVANSEVDAKRKAEISKLLNNVVENEGSFRNKDLGVVFKKYGTSDNVAKLVEIVQKETFGCGGTMRALGDIGDANGILAIAAQIHNFHKGREAKAVLKDVGLVGEQAVVTVMLAPANGKDRGLHMDCVKFLGEIGTRNVSVKAITFVANAYAKDKQMILTCQQSVNAINLRGK